MYLLARNSQDISGLQNPKLTNPFDYRTFQATAKTRRRPGTATAGFIPRRLRLPVVAGERAAAYNFIAGRSIEKCPKTERYCNHGTPVRTIIGTQTWTVEKSELENLTAVATGKKLYLLHMVLAVLALPLDR
jgi:hypothetical protein